MPFQAHQHCRGRNNRLVGRRGCHWTGGTAEFHPGIPRTLAVAHRPRTRGPSTPRRVFRRKVNTLQPTDHHSAAQPQRWCRDVNTMVMSFIAGLAWQNVFALATVTFARRLAATNPFLPCPRVEFATPTLDVSVQTCASRPSRAMEISRTEHVATRGGILRGQGLEILLERCLCNLCFMDARARHACLAFSTLFVPLARFFFSSFLSASIRSLTR